MILMLVLFLDIVNNVWSWRKGMCCLWIWDGSDFVDKVLISLNSFIELWIYIFNIYCYMLSLLRLYI